jgi:hypothetical protein
LLIINATIVCAEVKYMDSGIALLTAIRGSLDPDKAMESATKIISLFLSLHGSFLQPTAETVQEPG